MDWRKRLVELVPDQLSLGIPRSPLQAIFLPTRGRSTFADDAVSMLRRASREIAIVALPTGADDLELAAAAEVHFPSIDATIEFERIWQSLSSVRTTIGKRASDWDLPFKRSLAIWLCSRAGITKALLIDDDIRGIDADFLNRAASALDSCWLAGGLSSAQMDTSCIGHASVASGETILPFVSGNCLAINTQHHRPLFPPIYNEDWLSMLPALRRNKVVSVGTVTQLAIDPYSSLSRVDFQEPGEIFADAHFESWVTETMMDRGDEDGSRPGATNGACSLSFWHQALEARLRRLSSLARALGPNSAPAQVVARAYQSCFAITPEELFEFQQAWLADESIWTSETSRCWGSDNPNDLWR